MRTVALVGLAATTRDAVKNSNADEIWTLNWAYNYDFFPRIDRLFEMHPIWLYQHTDRAEYVKPKKHWEWLKQNKDIPVYMLAQLAEIPMCRRYPLEEVTEYIFGTRLLRGGQPSDFYSSSVDYMLALAIYEGWDVIELYGIEMGSTTEYRYQREGAAFFIGQATARGITVKREQNSILLLGKKYGYEGGQMIFRQDLERIHNEYVMQREEAAARLSFAEGKVNELVKDGADKETINKAFAEAQSARDRLMLASGAEQTCAWMIKEVDLEEVEYDLMSPLRTVPI